MKQRLLHIFRNFEVLAIFTLFWVIMNESASWLFIGTGMLISAAVLWLTNLLDHADYANDLFRSPLVVVRYFAFLAKEITLAAIAMAKVIVTGRATVTENDYHSELVEERKLFLLSTAITMTPGSITVAREGSDLLVLSTDQDAEASNASVASLERQIAEITR